MATLSENATRVINDFHRQRDYLISKGYNLNNVPTSEYVNIFSELIGEATNPGIKAKLNAVSISRSGDTVNISNPSTNGNFVENFVVYNNDEVLLTIPSNTTRFSLSSLGEGNYILSVKAVNSLLNDSEYSNSIKASVFTVNNSLANLSINNNTTHISNGLPYTATISPASGYYLPEDIVVLINGEKCAYEWDSYTGVITIPSVNGDVVIAAEAYTEPKLRRVEIELSGSILTVTAPRYAEKVNTYIDDTLEYEYDV